MDDKILQIAELLSGSCSKVMAEMSVCTADTGQYFEEHGQEYEIFENIEDGIEKEDYQAVQWIVLMECLVKNNIAGNLDWKCELEDFCFVMRELAGMKKYKLSFEKEWFCEDDSIEEWCSILNQKWQPAHCLAQIDMSSDSYIILPLKIADYEKVKKAANAVGQSIFHESHEKAEEKSVPHTLDAFFKKYSNMPSARGNRDEQTDACPVCTMHKEWINCWTLCVQNEFDCFQLILPPQELSVKQILGISRYFRLTALQIKKRIAAGKEIYVKTFLYHTLMAVKALDEMGIAYQVEPFVPQYSLFHECPKNIFFKYKNMYDRPYYRFDHERDKEWSAK